MLKARKENSSLQTLPLKRYEPRPYDEEAAKKYAASLEKLLPLIKKMKEVTENMSSKLKKLEAAQAEINERLKNLTER